MDDKTKKEEMYNRIKAEYARKSEQIYTPIHKVITIQMVHGTIP